jgi:phage repressor protein C with HTH and peptisase S24 domain
MDLYNKKDILIQSFNDLRKHGFVKTWTDFADIVGVNRSVLSAAKNGDEKYLTDTLMAKVKSAHELRLAPPTEEEISQEMVLVIPTGARAGTLADFSISTEAYDCERMVTPIKGADFAIQVTGDSMSPEYPSGSVILIKKINEKAFIEWGKTYVLDTENGAVIKNIRRTDNPEVIECVSLNPAYQPFTMETRYINGWYRVLMVLSLK